MQDTPHRRRLLAVLAPVSALLACALCASCECGRSGAPGHDEGALARQNDVDRDIARARAIAERRAPLPDRSETLAMVESIQARAVREGDGPRAQALYALGGDLFERLWRLEGQDRDADEAMNLYRGASRDLGAPGACDAAIAAARLAGDVPRDPRVTYAELYRARRRLAGTPRASDPIAAASCERALDDALAPIAAFRPPDEALAAIDDALAGEAGLGPRDGDASTAAAGAPAPLDPASTPSVTRVESWPGRESARVVVVLDRPAAYRVRDEARAGGTGPRTFLELDGVAIGTIPTDIPGQGLVTRIRSSSTGTGARVELDLTGHAWRHVFEMREPFRIVVDVARHPAGATDATDGAGASGGGARTAARAVSLVALDPGHGGSDRGARGASGLEEKDVALDIARRVAPVLEAQGMKVVLTRDEDRFVSLEERTARANALGADLFVSIHCNASEGRGRRGVETYVLDTSRDEIATRVAARENATMQGTLALGADLASILADMRMADGARRSRRLARLLLRAASTALQGKYGDAIDGGVHAAGFYVLVGARMPAVLFETGYISSPVDEQRFASADGRQLIADAIANALRAYREGR